MFRSLFRSVRSFFATVFGSAETAARLGVEYATLKLLDETTLSPRDVFLATVALDRLEALGIMTRGAVRREFREAVNFDRLPRPERLLVDAFVDRAFDAAGSFGADLDPGEGLRTVLGWVREAAERAE